LKKILIISPHFPPSNLAGVHRSRLFAQHLPLFGWEPVVLTVDEKYYEEEPDWNLSKLLPKDLRIEKARALDLTKSRLIGDIGLRAFFQLYKKAKELIKTEKIDFLYIPIPSFYVALLGRWLHATTGVKYGIDYIDPWVHYFPGSDKLFSRHWLSTRIANFLEPIAVKKASLITGVAEGYYKGVIERNPGLVNKCVFGAMPYGGEVKDHEKIKELNVEPYLFSAEPAKIRLVYAGAMLPKAFEPLEMIFQSIKNNPSDFSDIEFHFIGTGKTPGDENGFSIKPLAIKYNLWQTIVFEYPKRIPYLDVLVHLNASSGVFILGSTEPHYTPSKVYQAVLSSKPLLAVLHKNSSAVNVIRKTGTGVVLPFDEINLLSIKNEFPLAINEYKQMASSYNLNNTNMDAFQTYSAANVTKQLADLLNEVTKTNITLTQLQ